MKPYLLSFFFFPDQTGIGLEKRKQFLGVTFPNQTGFGLEKDTEWNLAVVGLELTLNQRPKLEGRNFGNTRKLPSMIFIKITRSVTIESTEHTSSEAKEMLNEY